MTMPVPIAGWTVDYGEGPIAVEVPHAWRQEVPATWEGPATYEVDLSDHVGPGWLLFEGVSYRAEVFVNGELTCDHRGIWDAFTVGVPDGAKKRIAVRVTKPGGASFPVREVAAGFLPFVFHTFGGIHGRVFWVEGGAPPEMTFPAQTPRVNVRGSKLYCDGQPYYLRGLLHWGWYPELGHTNPPEELIREEVRAAKELGFNLVKFCLWVPPHRYLEILEGECMWAWMELPIWDPSGQPEHLAQIEREVEAAVEQYRHHSSILCWTVGCELSNTAPAEFRKRLVEFVRRETVSPLVKDNSGGAEMYGGDPREFGDFNDFHPYCDTMFYPGVLASLLPGPRSVVPTLLGEFNDIDVHRDLRRLQQTRPYWSQCSDRDNPQGMRWQHDLPSTLVGSELAQPQASQRHARLMAASLAKAAWMRKFIQENVRSHEAISGYVVTGWRDTPISTAGLFDDWGEPRYSKSQMAEWNGKRCLFVIPQRKPPWVRGGNRVGYVDPWNRFAGGQYWRIGLHSESGAQGCLRWRITDPDGTCVAEGREQMADVRALESREVGQIWWPDAKAGEFVLHVEFDGVTNAWPIWIPEVDSQVGLAAEIHDPGSRFDGLRTYEMRATRALLCTEWSDDLPGEAASGANVVVFLRGTGCHPMPFWRESALEFADDPRNSFIREFDGHWSRLLPVCCDEAIDPDWLATRIKVAFTPWLNRVDTRTYRENSLVAAAQLGSGSLILTCLRPEGGLGCQPTSLRENAAGLRLIASLVETWSPEHL